MAVAAVAMFGPACGNGPAPGGVGSGQDGSGAGVHGTVSCTRVAGVNQCAAAHSASCGASACCPVDRPFYCAATNACYESQALAAAQCGSACVACNTSGTSGSGGGTGGGGTGTGGGGALSCSPPDTTQQCSTTGSVICGSGNDLGCCPAGAVAACVSTGRCYTTLAAAQADCGNSCLACAR